jgi:hypothetical protein
MSSAYYANSLTDTQILAKLAKGEEEENELIDKIENSCLHFDHDRSGVSSFLTFYKNNYFSQRIYKIKFSFSIRC